MSETSATVVADGSQAPRPHRGLFHRYRQFVMAPGTLFTAGNALLLALGLAWQLAGRQPTARWLYLASALVGGFPIYRSAIKYLVTRFDLTAGLMVSIAMTAALAIGEYSAAAIVALMMLVGDTLESLTVARADNALEELAGLVPESATVIRQGREADVALTAVHIGDTVLVRPGARIPVDGQVVSGAAAVDQAAITGESLPVDKERGDSVYAGTLCSGGALHLRVSRLGAETTLGRMVRLMKEARSTQAPVQRVANRYAQYLVPFALAIAAVVFMITGELVRGITVLIVICPCALVLATPTALVAAIGNAARAGVLVKSGTALEQIGTVNVVAFDKTGTVTFGGLSLVDIVPFGGLAVDELLLLAAGAEMPSEHPLARAVVAGARERGLKLSFPDDFRSLAGHGVSALVDNHRVVAGERAVATEGIAIADDAQSEMRSLLAGGRRVIPVAVDGAFAGFMSLADSVRPESGRVIRRLKELGVAETVLITGDNAVVAEETGRSLGVDRIWADALPASKLGIIRSYQAQGLKVAFVGDGVNDAAALAAADVGISMGAGGTAIAAEAAAVVLLADEIERVPYLIELSRKALGVVGANVVFSMSWNVLSVALGSAGIIGPVVGAVMHETSALPVLANAARLIAWRSRRTARSANAGAGGDR